MAVLCLYKGMFIAEKKMLLKLISPFPTHVTLVVIAKLSCKVKFLNQIKIYFLLWCKKMLVPRNGKRFLETYNDSVQCYCLLVCKGLIKG